MVAQLRLSSPHVFLSVPVWKTRPRALPRAHIPSTSSIPLFVSLSLSLASTLFPIAFPFVFAAASRCCCERTRCSNLGRQTVSINRCTPTRGRLRRGLRARNFIVKRSWVPRRWRDRSWARVSIIRLISILISMDAREGRVCGSVFHWETSVLCRVGVVGRCTSFFNS